MEIGFALQPSFQPVFTYSKSEKGKHKSNMSSLLKILLTSLTLIDIVPVSSL